jgi:hypothetical protein
VRLEGNIGQDADVAAECVRSVIRRAGEQHLQLVAIHVELRHVDLDFALPESVSAGDEAKYVQETGRLLAEAITKDATGAVARLRGPNVV